MSKAKVGDLIRITDSVDAERGAIFEVLAVEDDAVEVDGKFDDGSELIFFRNEYEILRKQAHQAQVGDLIRITSVRDEITAYKLGGIYEVTSLDCGNYNQIVINGENGQSGYVFADEYVVHRKAGEEDSALDIVKRAVDIANETPKTLVEGIYVRDEDDSDSCSNCGKEGVHTCRGAEYYAEQAEQDAVNPNHYKQGRVEVIDIIEDAVQGADPFEAVCQANILKYTLRYRAKNGVEDLRKSVWYANRLIDYLDAKSTR